MTAQIPLTRGLVAVIDSADLALVSGHRWHASCRRDGRGHYVVDGTGRRLHRVLMNPGPHEIVDHRNGDGLDNRRSNLRVGTQSGNCVNRQRTPGKHLRGTRPKKGRWQAYIKLGGKQRSLGYFRTEAEAHAAYLAEAHRLHGDWMPLPEPPDA